MSFASWCWKGVILRFRSALLFYFYNFEWTSQLTKAQVYVCCFSCALLCALCPLSPSPPVVVASARARGKGLTRIKLTSQPNKVHYKRALDIIFSHLLNTSSSLDTRVGPTLLPPSTLLETTYDQTPARKEISIHASGYLCENYLCCVFASLFYPRNNLQCASRRTIRERPKNLNQRASGTKCMRLVSLANHCAKVFRRFLTSK